MKLKNASITINLDREGVSIFLKDRDAVHRFLEVSLTPSQFYDALSDLAETRCEIEVKHLERVGKKRISKPMKSRAWDSSRG